MINYKAQRRLAITGLAASVLMTCLPVLSADEDNPLDPSFQRERAKPWATPPSPVRRTSSAMMCLDALGSGSRMSAVKARR